MRRASETRLSRTFAEVLTAVLAAGPASLAAVCVTGVAGCGAGTVTDDPGGGGGSVPTFTSLCTTPSPRRSFLEGIKATPPFDGAASRYETAFSLDADPTSGGGVEEPDIDANGDGWKGTTTETTGTMCATASDPSACRDKVSGYRVLPPNRDECVAQYAKASYGRDSAVCGVSYILYTRGDEIAVARTRDEIKALIGNFDTLEEAMWVTDAAGLSIACSSSGRQSGVPDSEYRTTSDGGWEFRLVEAPNCGATTFRVVVRVDYAGNLTELEREDLHVKPQCAVAGRRPEGFAFGDPACDETRGDAAGAYFASMAALETASVVAFRRLEKQLSRLGAPKELLGRIRSAARDEIRHARATRKLASARGIEPVPPRIPAVDGTPTVLELALDNAREGCVRETYGALMAHYQAVRAESATVRATMSAIAEEETAHAALSWDIAAWLDSRLSEADRAAVVRERASAFAALASELATHIDSDVARIAGIPVAADARRMLEGLRPVMLAA